MNDEAMMALLNALHLAVIASCVAYVFSLI